MQNDISCQLRKNQKLENKVPEMLNGLFSTAEPTSDVQDRQEETKLFEAPSAKSSDYGTIENVSEAPAPEPPTGSTLPEPGVDQTKNTIVIKNLPFKFKQSDLDSLLSDHGAHPKNVRMNRDSAGRFTGIVFLRCPSKEEAGRLIISMNNLDIGGRMIQVDFKQKKKKNKLSQSSDAISSESDFSSSLSSSTERPATLASDTVQELYEREIRRSTLRMSAEQEHVNFSSNSFYSNPTSLPAPVTLLSTAPPVEPQMIYSAFSNRRPSWNGNQFMFSNQYFANTQYQYQAQQLQTPQKPKFDLRRSGQYETSSQATAPPPLERRRSIATIEDPVVRVNRTGLGRPSSMPPPIGTKSTISPVRQPLGPDVKNNGFSTEYQYSRKESKPFSL